MTDPIRFLRAAIISYFLPDRVIYDGVVNPKADFPAVAITQITANDASAKHCIGWDVAVTVNIYNDALERGGNLATDEIADEWVAMVQDSSFAVTNFAVGEKKITSTSTNVVNLFNRVIYRRQININITLYG